MECERKLEEKNLGKRVADKNYLGRFLLHYPFLLVSAASTYKNPLCLKIRAL
jgi:hypothetical protein